MDTQKPVLSAISENDPELAQRLVDRRAAIKAGATVSGAVAAGLRMASIPVALAAVARDAFGQTTRLPSVVVNVLNYALLLEEFETAFYTAAVAAPGLIPTADMPIFMRIRDNERAHRDALRSALGAQARPAPVADFTGGNGSGNGPYADILTNYQTFLAAAQAIEDNGVRAVKGQAPNVMADDFVLTTALRFHFGELICSVPWRAAQVLALGITPSSFSTWQRLLFLSILFHHSNLRLPVRTERWLNRLLVTPRMHGIHHSMVSGEMNSNWSSGLTLWDRLHGTLKLNVPQEEITIGVPAYSRIEELTLMNILKLPFGEERPARLSAERVELSRPPGFVPVTHLLS